MSRGKKRHATFPGQGRPEQTVFGRMQILPHCFPARVLVGWFRSPFDELFLAGAHRPFPPATLLAQNRALIRTGRQLQSNLPIVDLSGGVMDLPATYASYVARLLGDPAIQQKLRQGYGFRLFDLTKVCVLQTVLSLNKIARMEAALDTSDPLSVVRLTLPITFAERLILPSLSSHAPSMRVAGIWTPVSTEPISHFHVAEIGGRLLMTDGHHRGFALLKSGIRLVPGFYRQASRYVELGMPPGLLPESLLQSRRPPLLGDFLIPGVAADIY